jgi:hypothetical protein
MWMPGFLTARREKVSSVTLCFSVFIFVAKLKKVLKEGCEVNKTIFPSQRQ